MPTKSDWGKALNILTTITVAVALLMVFLFAPTERTMGHVQRIFYFHVSAAWVGFFAFFVTLIGGMQYLRTRERRWDAIAASSVEIGVLFTTMVMVTGSIWARPTWNTWWTWDPRLTTITVLWLIYVSYLMLRRAIDDPDRRARFGAIYGIVGFVSVPLTFFAIRWWRTIHPLILQSQGFELDTRMLITLLVCLVMFTLLYFALLYQLVRLEHLSDQIEELKIRF